MEPINLAAECGEMPNGGELVGPYQGNLVLTVEGVLSWTTGPMRWGIRVQKPSVTASGRKGKPRHVILLLANDGEGPADLLRQLAKMWELGEVVPGEVYEAQGTTAGGEADAPDR